MDDNYFDEKLKDILENPPDFKPNAAAVRDMRRRLRAQRPQPFYTRPLAILGAALLLLLLLGNIFFYWNYRQVRRHLASIEQQIDQIQQKDTQLKQSVIYKIDTIYEVIYREKYIPVLRSGTGELPNFQFESDRLNRLSGDYLVTPLSKMDVSWSQRYLGVYPPAIPSGSSILPQRQGPDSDTIQLQFPWRPISSIPEGRMSVLQPQSYQPPLFLSDYQPEAPEAKQPSLPVGYYFTPTGLQLGMQAGPLIASDKDLNGSIYAIGIQTKVEFPENRRLQIGMEWIRMHAESRETASGQLPVLPPNNPGDQLNELYTYFDQLQVYTGLQQQFFSNRSLRPSISFGLVASKPVRQRYRYEYVGNSGEYKLQATLNEGALSMDRLRLGLGLEYAVGERLLLNSDLQYQFSISDNPGPVFALDSYRGINLGINYRILQKK